MTPKIAVRGMARCLRDVEKAVQSIKGSGYVTVGLHKAKATAGRKDGEPNNPTIGAINQFGTETIPARPWLDKGVERGAKRLAKHAAHCLKSGMEPRQMLASMGNMAVGEVKDYITDLDTPPNAPSTIRQKKSSSPLIDTGAMRQAVTFEVH